MSFSDEITLGTVPVAYKATVIRPQSTVRSDSSTSNGIAELTISHEVAKNGRVNSVVYLDNGEVIPCNDTCAISPTVDNIRAMFKISYNPHGGRGDLDVSLGLIIDELTSFLEDGLKIEKFLNKEH